MKCLDDVKITKDDIKGLDLSDSKPVVQQQQVQEKEKEDQKRQNILDLLDEI